MAKKLYLEVVVDHNDGDYITKKTEITKAKIVKVQHILDAIKTEKDKFRKTKQWNIRHNWETGEITRDRTPKKLYIDKGILTEDDVEFFEDNYMPYNDYGVHTIESIRLIEVSKEEDLV